MVMAMNLVGWPKEVEGGGKWLYRSVGVGVRVMVVLVKLEE